MSLWTPDGEHPVDRGGPGLPGAESLTAEQAAEAEGVAQQMAAVREQVLSVPAAGVLANHAMGCWELAAIHLSAQPPNFAEAQLAIDAFGALTDVLKGRLGADEATLTDALAQLRLAFVQLKATHADAEAPVTPDTTEEDGGD